MQAGAGHHVGFRAEDIARPLLDIDRFDETEARIVGIEEKVAVAVRAGFLASDGAKQIKSSHPGPVKIGFRRST